MLDAGLKTKHSRSFLPSLYVYPVSSIKYPVSSIKTITTTVLQKLDINFKIFAYIDG